MGADHPIAWWHAYQGGQAWYTAGGHTIESYLDPLFRRHLLGGLRYAAGLTPPKILRLSTVLQGRRLRVSVGYSSCRPCAGELRVPGVLRARLRLAAGTGGSTTKELPAGRRAVTVTLTDPKTGVRDSVSRRVVVR
jgi:hypothetical protein